MARRQSLPSAAIPGSPHAPLCRRHVSHRHRLVSGQMPEEATPTDFTQLALPESNESVLESALQASAEIQAIAQAAFPELVESLNAEIEATEQAEAESEAPASSTTSATSTGIMHYEPDPTPAPARLIAPPGSFNVSEAFGFDKTERLDGVTTCGWERSVEIRRVGDRLWIYIHSPGKKNGWGIFVDPSEFESAFTRVQQAAKSPFITSLAA